MKIHPRPALRSGTPGIPSGQNPNGGGFTLIEFLTAAALMALLSTLVYSLFTNCRRTAHAAGTVAERLRRELVLREMMQSELDRSSSFFTFEYSDDRLSGLAFLSYGDWGGRRLRIRARYVFEADPDYPVYRLMRYAIAEGIGVTETKEILLEGILNPVIEAYSEAAGEFAPAEKLPSVPTLLRLKFFQIRSWPSTSGKIESLPGDEFRLILTNGYVEKPAEG